MRARRFWIVLLVLAVLTPLGLWLPARLGAEGAWGEWSPDYLGKQVSFIPHGLAKIKELWKAPVPDYAPPGSESRSFAYQGVAYIVSAVVGLAVTGFVMWLLGRWLARRDKANAA